MATRHIQASRLQLIRIYTQHGGLSEYCLLVYYTQDYDLDQIVPVTVEKVNDFNQNPIRPSV